MAKRLTSSNPRGKISKKDAIERERTALADRASQIIIHERKVNQKKIENMEDEYKIRIFRLKKKHTIERFIWGGLLLLTSGFLIYLLCQN